MRSTQLKFWHVSYHVFIFLPSKSHSGPPYTTLHWLPVRERTDFKLSLIILKAWYAFIPAYIINLATPYELSHCLWSSGQQLVSLSQPDHNRKSRIIFNVDSFFILIVYHYPLLFFIFLFWFYCLLTSLATLPAFCPVIYKNCLCSWSSTNREHFVLVALCVTLLSNLNIAEVTDGGNWLTVKSEILITLVWRREQSDSGLLSHDCQYHYKQEHVKK